LLSPAAAGLPARRIAVGPVVCRSFLLAKGLRSI
jgi:hypothetical protein